MRTQNENYGFWGTMADNGRRDLEEVWTAAVTELAESTGADLTEARIFLDSVHGRHFADTVDEFLAEGRSAIESVRSAITEWQNYKVSSSARQLLHIPNGVPFLTGLLYLCTAE